MYCQETKTKRRGQVADGLKHWDQAGSELCLRYEIDVFTLENWIVAWFYRTP